MSRRSSRIASLAGALALSAATGARAQPAAARLDYSRQSGADDCPDAQELRDAVRARLGYDPFREDAVLALEATVQRAGDSLRARLAVSSPGEPAGERQLTSEGADCSELSSALALAIALAIDPLASPAPRPAPAPAPAPPPHGAPPPPPPPWRFEGHVSVLGALGAEPGPAAGLAVAGGVRSEALSLALELRTDLPGSTDAAGGTVSGAVSTVGLAPCYHVGALAACALGSVGAFRSSGEGFEDSRRTTRFYAEVGARAALEAPAAGRLSFHAHLDILTPLVRHTLTVGGDPAWTASPVIGVLGLGAKLRI